MSTIRKKFFKLTSKSESNSDLTKSNTRRELKFSPLNTKGFATQATYKQVKDALLVMIDERITDDLIDVRSCIENETKLHQRNQIRLQLLELQLKRKKTPKTAIEFYTRVL